MKELEKKIDDRLNRIKDDLDASGIEGVLSDNIERDRDHRQNNGRENQLVPQGRAGNQLSAFVDQVSQGRGIH